MLDWETAKTVGLLSAIPPPFNLLANGETGSAWSPPDQVTPTGLVGWKKGANGFGGSTARGLSLLFDPFVDACLLMNACQNGGKLPQKMTVLVLTDYYPLQLLLGQMSVWMGKIGRRRPLQTSWLRKNWPGASAICLKRSPGRIRLRKCERWETRSLAHALQIIACSCGTIFHFFVADSVCEGPPGLPNPSNTQWFSFCDCLLEEFLRCVEAAKVILAMSEKVREAHRTYAALPYVTTPPKISIIQGHGTTRPSKEKSRVPSGC